MAGLVKSGSSKDDAVKQAYEELKTGQITVDAKDGIAIATITSEGLYIYKEGGQDVTKVKDYENLKQALTGDEVLAVYEDHSKTKLVGVASDFVADDATRSIVGKIYHENVLPPGAGVSLGHESVDHEVNGEIHQEITGVDHVAASSNLVPRGDKNQVLVGDNKMVGKTKDAAADEPAAAEPDWKAKYDELDCNFKKMKDELDGLKKERKSHLIGEIKALHKDSFDSKFFEGLEAKSDAELNVIKDVLDHEVVHKPVFGDGKPVDKIESMWR